MLLLSVQKRQNFLALTKSSIKFHAKNLLIVSGPTPEQYWLNPHSKKYDDFSRLGLTVTKKIGKAVIRNKIKRRLREVFRELAKKNYLVNRYDFVVIAKKNSVNADFSLLEKDILFCLKHIKRQINVGQKAN